MSRPIVGIGVPMVVRFGPADVGRRVTLRRRLPEHRPEAPSYGDVVGVLEAWSDGLLTVRRRTGELVTVEAATVAAGRVVAPEISAADLAGLADDAWRARETAPLGAWRMRAHGGLTHRPNSALATGDPGVPVEQTADVVRRWYDERGLRPAVMTPVPSAVADAYAELGWVEDARTLVQAAPLADVLASALDGSALDGSPAVEVTLTDTLPDDWSTLLERLRDSAVAPLFRALLTGSPTTCFATVRDGGTVIAVARGALTGSWVNLTNVEVAPAARGQRIAAHLVVALARWADAQGAYGAYLQQWPDNAAALRLYARLGFKPHHEYVYFNPPR